MIKNIGIIGAGQMGGGIAQVSAAAGYKVLHLRHFRRPRRSGPRHHQRQHGPPGLLRQADRRGAQEGAVAASRRIRRYQRSRPMPISSSKRRPRTRASSARSMARSVRFSSPMRSSPPTPRRSRSPGLPSPTDRPERFIGIHFMNPVPVMKLVELVRGIATEDETFEAAKEFVTAARQDDHRCRGFSGLHRQPHPAADDQRGDLHAL